MKPYLLSLPPAVSPSLSLSPILSSLSRSPLPPFPGRPPAPPFPGRPPASPSPTAHGLEASTGSSISMRAGSSFPTRTSGRIRLGAERGVEQDELADELARRIERGVRAGRPPRARSRVVGRGGCRDSSQRTATISLNLLPQQLLAHPSRRKRVHLQAWGGRMRQGRGGYSHGVGLLGRITHRYVSNLEFLGPMQLSMPIRLGYVSPAYLQRIRIRYVSDTGYGCTPMYPCF